MEHFTTHRPNIMGTNWMVTADHPLAVRAGAAALECGGSAIDAAIAANLVMTVVRPHMCGMGGDLIAMVYDAKQGKAHTLNSSGRAPITASLQELTSRGLRTLPGRGPLAVTVSGAVLGWQALLDRWGTMDMTRLAAFAIDYARHGFPCYAELGKAISKNQEDLAQDPSMAALFLPGGKPPRMGQLIRQEPLAGALKALAENGPEVFYNGPLGRSLVERCQELGGWLSMDDLADHQFTWEEPLTTQYQNHVLLATKPNTQGIALLMQAELLECMAVNTNTIDSAQLTHLMVEIKKLAFADRDRYVCDPSFYAVPVGRMLDKKDAAQRVRLIDPGYAAEGYAPRDFTKYGEDTVFMSVVDREGNGIALIQSIFSPFGSCVMAPETGIILHNRGLGFSLDPNHPNHLAPGKRPYHTLAPVMVLKDERLYLILGSPGADGQTQTVMQLLVNLLSFGTSPQGAIEAPRWRSDPDGILHIEDRFSPTTLDTLRAMGHKLEVKGPWDEMMGSAQIIRIDQTKGVLTAGADPRRQAYALGA